MGTRIKRAQRGFSLLEVLVALVIASLGLLSLAQLQTSLIRAASHSKAQTLAMAIARHKIEQLSSVQSLGGEDNTCVSPTAWVLGQTSCYRAVADEPGPTAVDGDPITAGTQALGGVNFNVATAVSRYVYNVSTAQYALANDTALDSALITTPETLLPGKEFKRIVVTVNWSDAAGNPRNVQVEDALNAMVPRDSIALLVNRKGAAIRRAEAIIVDPGTVAGVIPVAMGNGSSTAASNPTPELLGGNNATYVAETHFDVYSYLPLDSTSALAQSRIETSVVGCRCDTATASATEKSLRPTFWNGVQYVQPSQANYPTIAGPKALSGGELPQSDLCRVCCRDHHDPAGNDVNGDPLSSVAMVSPRRSVHSHFLVDNSTGARTAAPTGAYSEVCRMIRVGGVFRVAADLQDDYFALLPARNTGLSPFAPGSDVGDDYADMVKKYINDRITAETNNAHYNDSHNASTPAGPNPASYETGTRTLSDGVTNRSYNLNLPADYFLKLTGDSRWLHARGLYIDYLTPEAIAKIDFAKLNCPTQPATNDCILPLLPFTSINLSELAEWKDIALNPANASSGQVISVMNNGFKTATGDESYPETGASGSAGSTIIAFAGAISGKVVAGMTVAGVGVADGARVTAVANNSRSVTVDKANTGSVGTTVTFEGAPVRGLASPGATPSTGNTSYARAIASYNNAAIALKYPMNSDEGVLQDQQRIEMNASGAPPDPTAGTFTVTGFRDASNVLFPFGTPYPVTEWGTGLSGSFSINPCTRGGSPLPYLCSPTSGLGGPMRIRVSGYNVKVNKSESFSGSCKKPSGGFVAVSGTTSRPYCRNYDVISASAQDSLNLLPALPANGSAPYTVTSAGKSAESTEIVFSLLNNNDVITVGVGANGEAAGTFVSCTATGGGNLNVVTWSDPCQ